MPRPIGLLTLAAAACAVPVLLAPAPAAAWGEEGHAIVCEIAWQEMSPAARQAAAGILGDAGTLPAACLWADEIRGDPTFDWVRSLHYVNVGEDADEVDAAAPCPSEGCVLSGIEGQAATLRNTSATAADRLQALRLLGHFVGDVHQPLHVSYAEDQGGNKSIVDFFGQEAKLHAVWDSLLLDHDLRAWSRIAHDLRRSVTADERTAWTADGPIVWANESLAETRAIYAEPHDRHADLGKDYVTKWRPVALERMRRAGVRLGHMLDDLLDPS